MKNILKFLAERKFTIVDAVGISVGMVFFTHDEFLIGWAAFTTIFLISILIDTLLPHA